MRFLRWFFGLFSSDSVIAGPKGYFTLTTRGYMHYSVRSFIWCDYCGKRWSEHPTTACQPIPWSERKKQKDPLS
jgi:hypothetical protein